MPKRDEKGRVVKGGGSLNPGGRPKAVAELVALARESVPEAFALAKAFLGDEKLGASVRLEAARFIVAYGVGAPPKALPDKELEELTDEQLRTKLREVLGPEAANAAPAWPHEANQ